MSATEPVKKSLFVVYAPDYADEEGLSRRLAARPKHLERAKPLIESGTLKVGGAMVTPETIHTESKKMTGSVMIFEAESLEFVQDLIHNDPYWVEKVWDHEKTVIMPFMSGRPL